LNKLGGGYFALPASLPVALFYRGQYNKKLFFWSINIRYQLTSEVERALVAFPDFKSGVPGE